MRDELADSLQELRQWRAALMAGDLRSRVRDLTALDVWAAGRAARRRGAGLAEAEAAYDRLAVEVLDAPDALASLEEWFSSRTPKSGGTLGYALGKLDNAEVLAPVVRDWATRGRGDPIVLSYLRGVSDRAAGLPASWVAFVDTLADKQPRVAFLLTARADPSDRGFERALTLVGRLPAPPSAYLGELAYGPWQSLLDVGRKGRLLRVLLDLADGGDPRATGVGFDLLATWHAQGDRPLDPDLVTVAVPLAERSSEGTDLVDPHDWQVALGLLAPHRPLDVAKWLVRTLTSRDEASFHRHDGALELLTGLASSGHGAPVMQAIVSAMRDPDRAPFFAMLVYRGLFEAIGADAVRGAVGTDADLAEMVARHVASPRLDDAGQPVVPDLTLWLLTTFEGDDRVFRAFLAGRHSGEARWGSAASHAAETRRAVSPFLQHEAIRIREWAQHEFEYSERSVEREARWDEERNRGV